jgi:hypothetical protein
MRLGTWNLDAGASAAHVEFLLSADCDVWLLTEVSPKLQLPGYTAHATQGVMGRGQHWAGVFSRLPMQGLEEPHGASDLVLIEGYTFCASVLPWRSCGDGAPWRGASITEKTTHAVDAIVRARPSIWGGDWNHSFHGQETAGSNEGREVLRRAVRQLDLHLATEHSPHHRDGLFAIDHLAVPWEVTARRLAAGTLSDHDAYVLDAP